MGDGHLAIGVEESQRRGGRERAQRPKRRPWLPPCAAGGKRSIRVEAPSPLPPITPSPQPLTSAAKQSTSYPYLIETRWTAVRQVQARASGRNVAVGWRRRRGRGAGRKAKGWLSLGTEQEGATSVSLLFPLTVSLAGGVTVSQSLRSEPGDS